MTASGSPDLPYRVGSAPDGVRPPTLAPAPEFDRRVKYHRSMLYGLLLVGVLPVLAMFGLFGVHNDSVTTDSDGLAVTVDYPRNQRYKVRQPLRIEVTNAGEAPIPVVDVAVSAPYVFAFSDVALTPAPSAIDMDTYNFTLRDIGPGGTRRIAMEMQAEEYWLHRGTVSWTVQDTPGEPATSGTVDITTMVWP